MKIFGYAMLAGLGAAALATPANAATHEWRGGGYLTYLTQACADDGWPAQEYVSARYRPRNLGDNGPDTRLSFFHPLFVATNFTRQNGAFTTGFKPVISGVLGAGIGVNTADGRLKATLAPSSVKTNTETVRIVGEIRNYANTAGCNVSFDVSLTRRP